MGIPNVMHTGRSGMVAARAAIATTGHNISNANTEGYSRQRVELEANVPVDGPGRRNTIGQGVNLARISRVNDEYIEKELQNGTRDLSHFEEKDVALRQLEEVFNELNGDGINRLMSRFFNEFRKLSNDPDSEAVRQSVRESTHALTNDFHRLRKEVEQVREHIDSRISAHTVEINSITSEVADLNQRIRALEVGGTSPNDLKDRRGVLLKRLASYFSISVHDDGKGGLNVDIKGVGPLVTGNMAQDFEVVRSKAKPAKGKLENALDIKTSASANSIVTHTLKGGRLGGLIEVRDRTLSAVIDRLDDLAFGITKYVNQVHTQGMNRNGVKGIKFFKEISQKDRASEFISLSDEVAANTSNIATAFDRNAPGDNRVAVAISQIQYEKLMNNGEASMDDWYNSIVSDIGIVRNRNMASLSQTKNVMTHLDKMRDQISGVSLDEETANLLQFQHTFDVSAKVIQVAEELLDSVLAIKS